MGGQIENCYVTDVGIFANTNDYFLYAGGISGKPANVTNSGIFYVAIKGNIFNAGGIAGSAGGSRLYSANNSELSVFYGGNIRGCFVRRFSAFVENAAGGIAGEASTKAETASGTNIAVISNSYATELELAAGVFEDERRTRAVKIGATGGIIGTDGIENHGHLVTNTVSIADYAVIGAQSKSVYDSTVRLAPSYAFYQPGILDVINRNTVMPGDYENETDKKEIFTGSFIFANDNPDAEFVPNSDEYGRLPFPREIAGLFEITQYAES